MFLFNTVPFTHLQVQDIYKLCVPILAEKDQGLTLVQLKSLAEKLNIPSTKTQKITEVSERVVEELLFAVCRLNLAEDATVERLFFALIEVKAPCAVLYNVADAFRLLYQPVGLSFHSGLSTTFLVLCVCMGNQ